MGPASSLAETFEILLAEWHLPPAYILNNWTDELLDLMIQKLVERKRRESEGRSKGPDISGNIVTDSTMFNLLGLTVRQATEAG